MPNLLCMVATPTRELFSGEIAYADVPGSEGNYGVLSGHEMLVAKNSPGVLTLWMDAAGNEKRRFALYEGATQVYADRLTVLARFGVDVDNIDAEAVRKKADGMRERVAELEAKHADDPEVESYGAILETSRARLAWYETQLRVAEGAPAK
ncbi:MAG: F0F1 ATP synthase subunit epsilon [Gordonibacter pamelaeae]|nr:MULTISPECIES: F0F1 ATP synthase subunit epsilon [Gordonibacter]MBS6976186.1 F0F1 ATP synthase subunit epsilon [Eggerthellaceae bacterium]MBS4895741.1 F0F1 ATP synthase subunit epsilon [Gordonibacter pamelaeae]MCB6312512.1 F0F1 ATP synthase subunit epsilon [Gordonibacter pamelaeae]MCB6561697.1 F0F1 ATP synthase subunit epsilon [Gordonibacter urolithinfaciens]MCQ4846422.1 F0F1 ATP synthase subunit epsilon [Gordonibacter pamelaeae]